MTLLSFCPAEGFYSANFSVIIEPSVEEIDLSLLLYFFLFQKLRMFSAETGILYPTDSDIGALVNQQLLFSGSSLVLEYVDNHIDCIEDLTVYRIV